MVTFVISLLFLIIAVSVFEPKPHQFDGIELGAAAFIPAIISMLVYMLIGGIFQQQVIAAVLSLLILSIGSQLCLVSFIKLSHKRAGLYTLGIVLTNSLVPVISVALL